jgi:hypothetical protein
MPFQVCSVNVQIHQQSLGLRAQEAEAHVVSICLLKEVVPAPPCFSLCKVKNN